MTDKDLERLLEIQHEIPKTRRQIEWARLHNEPLQELLTKLEALFKEEESLKSQIESKLIEYENLHEIKKRVEEQYTAIANPVWICDPIPYSVSKKTTMIMFLKILDRDIPDFLLSHSEDEKQMFEKIKNMDKTQSPSEQPKDLKI